MPAVTMGVPSAWVRRPLSIGLLLVAGVLVPIALPVGMALGLLADLVSRRRGLRWTRTVLFVCLLVVFELLGLLLTAPIWLFAPLGVGLRRPLIQRYCRWLMTWWAGRLLFVITLCIPIEIDTSELDRSLLDGNAIVIGRHRSLLDAIIPAVIFGRRGLTVLYALKEDLRWEPNIDLVGHVMRQRFVTREPADLEAELEPLRELGRRVDDRHVAVIFPEGTFFTEERKARAVRTLEQVDPAHADAAQAMQHLLPPRPAGTLALLEGAPGADVIVLGHVGFERFGTISRIFSGIGTPQHVRVRAWRIPRRDVPTDPRQRIDWLFDTWAELDAWIHRHPVAPATS